MEALCFVAGKSSEAETAGPRLWAGLGNGKVVVFDATTWDEIGNLAYHEWCKMYQFSQLFLDAFSSFIRECVGSSVRPSFRPSITHKFKALKGAFQS